MFQHENQYLNKVHVNLEIDSLLSYATCLQKFNILLQPVISYLLIDYTLSEYGFFFT
jgi:hypothetical protein